MSRNSDVLKGSPVMKKFLLLVVVMAFVPVLVIAGSDGEPVQGQYVTIHTADDNLHHFEIELAVTQEEMTKGLMFREELDPGAGMLFLFETDSERAFWMKDTLIPLDIIFIRTDGTIHRIHSMASPQDLTRIRSNGPVRAVLEVNGGLSETLGIKAGDTVHHESFANKLAD